MQIAQTDAPIIEVQHLYKDFAVNSNAIKSGKMRALSDITFNLHRGRALAVVGESGSGKSTIAKIIAKMYKLSNGRILYRGRDLEEFNKGTALLDYRQSVQMVWQDPFGSLNPTHTIYHHIARPLLLHSKVLDKKDLPDMVYALLEKVGLTPAKATAAKYPHQLSGGQRQRVMIAMALANRPDVLIADEPTTALDVTVQAQILDLLRDLQDQLGLTYLFISHDLAVVRHMANRVGVMYLGRIAEIADSRTLFARPRHPYTRMLLATIPSLAMRGQRADLVRGEVPNPITPPPGCSFHPRCALANERCRREAPLLRALGGGQQVACHAVAEGRDHE